MNPRCVEVDTATLRELPRAVAEATILKSRPRPTARHRRRPSGNAQVGDTS
jgi:hypothetical protein